MLLSRNSFHKATAELVGTFALVFAGCGSVMVAERFPGTMGHGSVPVVFGLVVAAMIYAVGHISGAHFNPAVTLGFAVARRFPLRHVLAYWVAQVLGAVMAMSLLWILLPAGASFGATVPMVPIAQAVAWEAVLTFFLMFVIIAVATDTRAVGTMAGAAIGATVMLCAFFGGPVTGASMNPARSLAPALFEGKLGVFWIYLLGPVVGAIVAAKLYEWIRCDVGTAEPGDAVAKDAKGCC
jgi:MIP family channel proteins